MLWSLLLNIVAPSAVLLGALDALALSPSVTLGIALIGPLGYGLWDLGTNRRVNPVSALGVISVALTGGVGLLELDAGWIAVKEAAIPIVLVGERGAEQDLARLIRRGTAWLAVSFLASAAISYALAATLVHSPPNTPEFNAELGLLTMWSLPAIALPSLLATLAILWGLLGGLGRLTDLSLDELVAGPARDDSGAG